MKITTAIVTLLSVTIPLTSLAESAGSSNCTSDAKRHESGSADADVAKAQKKLDAARAELEQRRKDRSKTESGTPEYDAADKRVQEFKVEVEKAGSALRAAQAKAGSKPEEKKPEPAPDRAAADAEIARAQKKLDSAKADLENRYAARGRAEAGTPDYDSANKRVQEAKSEIEKASTALKAAKARPIAKPEEKKPDPAQDRAVVEAEIAKAQKKLDSAKAELENRYTARGRAEAGTPDYDSANKRVQEAKAEIEKASAALKAAKARPIAKPEEKKPEPAPDRAAIEAEIAKAQKKLDSAKADLENRFTARGRAEAGTPDYDSANKRVQEAKAEIEKASAALKAAKAKLR